MALEKLRRLLVEIVYDVDAKSFKGVNVKTDDIKKRLGEAAKKADEFGKRLGDAAKKAAPALAKAQKAIKGINDRADQAAASVAKFALASGTALFGGAVAATISSEELNARLVTITGSAENAADVMAQLTEFTKDNSLTVSEAAQAYAKLKTFGLDPSNRAIESFGNTAVATEKSLDQLVEAAADATRGSFERLQEFGIAAKKEGDKVAFTFNNQTTTIGNNAEEIQEFLIQLGEQNFGDAMANQVNTLGVQLKKARERSANFLAAIGEGGLSSGIRRLLDRIEALSAGSGGLAEQLGRTAGEALDRLGDALEWATQNTELLRKVVIGLGIAFAGLKVLNVVGQLFAFGKGAVAAAAAIGSFGVQVVKAVDLAVAAVRFLAIGMGPLAIKIAAVTAAVLLLVDAFRFVTGQGGLIQDFVERFAGTEGALGTIADTLKEVRGELAIVLSDVIQIARQELSGLADVFKDSFGEFVLLIKDLVPTVTKTFRSIAKVVFPILAGWVKRFISVQTTIARVAVPIIGFLAKFAAFMVSAQLKVATFAAKVGPFLFKVSAAFRKFFVPVEDGLRGIGMLFDLIRFNLAQLEAFVAPVFEKLGNFGGMVFDKIERAFNKFLDSIRKIVREISNFVDLPEEVLDFAFGPGKKVEERESLEAGKTRAEAAAAQVLAARRELAELRAQVGPVTINVNGTVSDASELVSVARGAFQSIGDTLTDQLRNVVPPE